MHKYVHSIITFACGMKYKQFILNAMYLYITFKSGTFINEYTCMYILFLFYTESYIREYVADNVAQNFNDMVSIIIKTFEGSNYLWHVTSRIPLILIS